MKRACVVGAGVTGLATALLLRRRGLEVEVLEAAETVGGMVRPFRFRGVDCDLGSHRLHPSAWAEPLLRELSREIGLTTRPRRGRIVLGGRHIAYPLSLTGLLQGLGPRRAARFCAGVLTRPGLRSWESARTAAGADVGFEAFVLRRVGRAAYDGFYRPYVDKVWGLPPDTLSQTVAKARVSSQHPVRAVASMLRGRNRTFLYPRRGMGALTGALAQKATDAGVTVSVGRPVRHARDLARLNADLVVHTGDLSVAAPHGPAGHRGLYLVFLALPVAQLSPVDTWYAPEPDYWFGRVSEVGNFSSAARRPHETVICVEIPEGKWGLERDFIKDMDALIAQLWRARIVPAGMRPLEARQHFLPAVYPLYRRGWVSRWREALADVAQRLPRVRLLGRRGLYLHCNIDHCLSMARALERHVGEDGDARDWANHCDAFLGLQVRD